MFQVSIQSLYHWGFWNFLKKKNIKYIYIYTHTINLQTPPFMNSKNILHNYSNHFEHCLFCVALEIPKKICLKGKLAKQKYGSCKICPISLHTIWGEWYDKVWF